MAGGGDDRHQVTFPARSWAELLDLDDPAGAEQRRIRAAVSWLEDAGLVLVDRPACEPPTITLLREDGSHQS